MDFMQIERSPDDTKTKPTDCPGKTIYERPTCIVEYFNYGHTRRNARLITVDRSMHNEFEIRRCRHVFLYNFIRFHFFFSYKIRTLFDHPVFTRRAIRIRNIKNNYIQNCK